MKCIMGHQIWGIHGLDLIAGLRKIKNGLEWDKKGESTMAVGLGRLTMEMISEKGG